MRGKKIKWLIMDADAENDDADAENDDADDDDDRMIWLCEL